MLLILAAAWTPPAQARLAASADSVNDSWQERAATSWHQLQKAAEEKITSWTKVFKTTVASLTGGSAPNAEKPAVTTDTQAAPVGQTAGPVAAPSAGPAPVVAASPKAAPTPEQKQLADMISHA